MRAISVTLASSRITGGSVSEMVASLPGVAFAPAIVRSSSYLAITACSRHRHERLLRCQPSGSVAVTVMVDVRRTAVTVASSSDNAAVANVGIDDVSR